jgi:hypothetical protein
VRSFNKAARPAVVSRIMAEDPKYAEAVSRLKDALVNVDTGTREKMERQKNEVLKEFQHVFAPETIEKLEPEEFRDFLKFSKNKHWSGLSRGPTYHAADEEKMRVLREALGILLNEKKEPSVAKRLDEVRSTLKNVSKAVLTPILQVAHPGRYGVWNTKSEAGLKQLGLWPKFERGTSFGKRYETINNLLLKLRDSVGGIDLWTLDVLWFSVKDSVAEAAVAAAEIEQDNDEGYPSDPRIRKAIEKHAMKVAQEHYEKNEQYTVDPEKYRTESYDMECKKDGSTLHVEVKGTQGSGKKIILTEREIEHAERQPMELCVVWGIKVEKGKASGGTLAIYREWNPRHKYKMECIAYRCTLPKQS